MEHAERLKAALSDRYLIEREIGSGGMATVYLAQDLKHERQVAVKVLDPDLAQNLGAERFLREIKTVARLTHPHILPVHDSGEADGFLFFVMPYVKGESLRARLTKEKQLPVEDAIQITREIADALAYAHEEGVIHRDVKPANIMLEAGHAVLADFGVAHAVSAAKDQRLTRTGTSLGTPSYMSPEQATGEQDLDGRSDQYALGCVLYEMLAGHPPFTGAQVEAVIRQHLMEEPPLVTKVRPSITQEVVKVINRALAKSPADRFKTTGEMAAALALTTAPTRKEPRRSLGTVGTILALATVVIAAVAVGMSVLGPGRDAEPPRVAVLPPISHGMAEGSGFAEGLAIEIQRRLSLVSGLNVTAYYSGDDNPRGDRTLVQMGEDLGVDYLLTLNVFQEQSGDSGPNVRLNAELVRVSDGGSEWADSFDGESESGFALHREISSQVVEKLDINLAAREREALETSPTDNPLALDLFQEALRVFRLGATREINLRAAEGFQLAIDEDSTFALAYAYLAKSLFAAGRDQDIRLGQQALARAKDLDPDISRAQLLNGSLLYAQGRYDQAAEVWREALRARPSDVDLLEALGQVERRLGNWDESLALLNKAWDLNPLDPNLVSNLAISYLKLRLYDEAELLSKRRGELAEGDEAVAVDLAHKQAWIRLQSRGDIIGAERVLRQAAEQYGLDQVLRVLATSDMTYLWFSLPDWSFRQDLRESSFEELGASRGNFYLARAFSEQAEGNSDAALAYYDSVRVIGESRETLTAGWHSALGMAYAGLGRVEEAVREAEEGARLRSVSMDALWGTSNLMWLARVLVMVGDDDRAVEVLDSLVRIPSEYSKTWVQINPFFDPLRGHPGFQALVEGPPKG